MDRRSFLKLLGSAVALAEIGPAFAQETPRPLWIRRGKDEFNLDVATIDGYRAAAWMLRDVQANVSGWPHPHLLLLLSWSQAWLASHHYYARYDILSGLRTKATNDRTEGASRASTHLPDANGYFFGVDFRSPNLDAGYTAQMLRAVGMGGVGLYYQREFVHGDIARPRSWRKP